MLKQNQSTVEKFEDLKRQHSDTRMFHNLWKLKVLEERSTAANQNMKQIIQDIDNISDRTNELNSTLSTKKMLHSTAVKDLIKLNKTYDQKNDHINASKQKLMSLEGQEKHLDDNMKNASNSLRRAEALHEKQVRNYI